MPYPPPAVSIVVRSAGGEHENDATNSLEVQHSQRANNETNGDTIEPDRSAREKARRDV
jgi:hypothetical protein